MCKNQTAVSHSSTESEIISLDAGLRLDGIPALDLWDLNVLVLGNSTQKHDRTGRPVVCPQTNHGRQQSRRVINDLDNVDFVSSNVQSSNQEALLYVIEEKEAVIKMIMGERRPTMRHCFQNPQSCSWLVVWSNQLGPKNPNHMYWIDTKNQLADMLTKGSFTRDEWIIFCLCLTSAISVPQSLLRWCRKEHKKNQVKKESQQSQDQWWIWSREAMKGLHQRHLLLHQNARGKPDTKVKVLWVRKLRSTIERGDPLFPQKERTDPLFTHTHQATQNGMLMELGLLKSGNLMNWWMIERGDPLFALSERINSLLKTTKQNQSCR